MPSILNTPTNEIPLHLFCLPITQREVLLVNILTDPILYEQIINSTLYHDDPTFTQATIIFRNYVLIRQLFSHLTVPHLLVQITKAFDPTLSTIRTTVLVLLVDRGLDRLLGTLPRDHLTLTLRTVILSLSEEQWRAYYGTNDPVEGAVQTGQENGTPPTYSRTDPHSPRPARASSPTKSLSSTNTAINPPPQMAQPTNPFPCCSGAAPLSTRE